MKKNLKRIMQIIIYLWAWLTIGIGTSYILDILHFPVILNQIISIFFSPMIIFYIAYTGKDEIV